MYPAKTGLIDPSIEPSVTPLKRDSDPVLEGSFDPSGGGLGKMKLTPLKRDWGWL